MTVRKKSLVFLSLLLLLGTSVTEVSFAKTDLKPLIDEPSQIRFSNMKLKTGVRVHYAEQGNQNGPVVLMLHGYTDSWFSYSRVLPLMDRKYHIYVLDQRGHGESERPEHGYSPQQFAQDVLAFMDKKQLNNVSVVGHSMGSFVAQHLAALAPERIDRLVLVGSAASARNDVVRGLQKEVNSISWTVSEEFVKDFQSGMLAQPVPDEFMNRIIQESQKLPAVVWKAVINDLVVSKDAELNKIKAPTLVVWGDRENVFSKSEQDTLLSGIKNSRLLVYENTGHCPNWESPERFAKDVQQFIEGYDQRSSFSQG